MHPRKYLINNFSTKNRKSPDKSGLFGVFINVLQKRVV